MSRRPLNRHELRAAHEAAEALGITTPEPSRPRTPREPNRPRPEPTQRMRVVWAVCDLGGRTVATFDFPKKAEAEAHAAALKAKTKDAHFVRQVKEPIDHPHPGRGPLD